MFGLFKKKNPIEKLYDQYEKLLSESHKLSHIDRTAADAKAKEADEILAKIKELEGQE
jgi:hypothetical protein